MSDMDYEGRNDIPELSGPEPMDRHERMASALESCSRKRAYMKATIERYEREAVDLMSLVQLERKKRETDSKEFNRAINFSLVADDGLLFLRMWREGAFTEIEKEWQDWASFEKE